MRRRQLQERIAALEKRLAQLEAKVREACETERRPPEPAPPKVPEAAPPDPYARPTRKIRFETEE
ncbi:MAG: hypothetical protein WB999_18735 [Candidatus Binataceae bacterium]